VIASHKKKSFLRQELPARKTIVTYLLGPKTVGRAPNVGSPRFYHFTSEGRGSAAMPSPAIFPVLKSGNAAFLPSSKLSLNVVTGKLVSKEVLGCARFSGGSLPGRAFFFVRPILFFEGESNSF